MSKLNYSPISAAVDAQTFDNFTYDFDITTADFDEISKIMEEVNQAIEDVVKEFNTIKNCYDDFSGFEERLNDNMAKLKSLVSLCQNQINAIVKESKDQVAAHKQVDTASQQNIEQLNSSISKAGSF
jgi:archaellum component FlaC